MAMANFFARFLVLSLAVSLTGFAQDSAPWHDPSKHTVQFVTVEKSIRLEVLDWGGTGRPVVLLAGSGNTAHIFDDFAEIVGWLLSRLRHHATRVWSIHSS
jgi:hypothetical protein